MNKCVFLDRDGVINPLIFRSKARGWTPPWTLDEFKFFDGIDQSLKKLKHNGYKLFIVSNQPDIWTNETSIETISEINNLILDKLPIDDIMTCHQRGHYSYKPNPGMLIELKNKYNIDMTQSWMVGDTWKDAVCAHIAHVYYIHVGKEDPISKYVFCQVADLNSAVDIILDPVDF